ncbi:Lar family restriction alleviation protein [Candidatus Sumerlaeota bacterium]|nr:Lar family restriction alleviation protein [Candidatus Sumerlaeota bacterium]
MSEVLKPCPFCGGEGEAVCLRAGEDSVWSWVRCLSCGARTDEIEAAYSDLPSAKATWNTRAALSLPTPTIDREAMVEAAIEAWHGRDLPLHEWLGWSWDEYAVWVANGTIPRPPKPFAALLHPIDDISDTGEAK